MRGYTEACGSVDNNTSLIATRGINNKGQKGAWKGVFKANNNFKFDSIASMKLKDTWDSAVAAGNLTYIGIGKFDDQSAEATFFEDTALNFKVKQTDATKVLGFQLLVCDCTNAELLKLDGQSSGLFFQTASQYGIGRLNDDGKVSGLAADITVNLRSLATDDTPAEYSRLVFSFTDPKADEMNPCSAKLDFLFSEVDQVGRIGYKVSGVSNGGSALAFTLDIYEDCSTTKVAGFAAGDFKAVDKDGNTLAIASLSDSSGTYTGSITTALTLAYIKLDGIKTVNSLLWISDSIKVST
jgi:hypothetical protein